MRSGYPCQFGVHLGFHAQGIQFCPACLLAVWCCLLVKKRQVNPRTLMQSCKPSNCESSLVTPTPTPSPTRLQGGAARFVTKVRELQREWDSLILFSGDVFNPCLLRCLHNTMHLGECNRYPYYGGHYFPPLAQLKGLKLEKQERLSANVFGSYRK